MSTTATNVTFITKATDSIPYAHIYLFHDKRDYEIVGNKSKFKQDVNPE